MNLTKWNSRGRTISMSNEHNETFIVDNNDGTFHTIRTNIQNMLRMNPPDDKPIVKRKVSISVPTQGRIFKRPPVFTKRISN